MNTNPPDQPKAQPQNLLQPRCWLLPPISFLPQNFFLPPPEHSPAALFPPFLRLHLSFSLTHRFSVPLSSSSPSICSQLPLPTSYSLFTCFAKYYPFTHSSADRLNPNHPPSEHSLPNIQSTKAIPILSSRLQCRRRKRV